MLWQDIYNCMVVAVRYVIREEEGVPDEKITISAGIAECNHSSANHGRYPYTTIIAW